MKKRFTRSAVAGGVMLALVAAGCSSNTGSDDETKEHGATSLDIIGDAEDSKGPAPKVKGAVKGGEIKFLNPTDFTHLDPQRAFVSSYLMTGNGLLWRALNGYQERDGEMTVVGDLATDPGKDVKGDCTVWEYTLKDGIKYEDGSEITAKDVAYGVARSFEEKLTDGPAYLEVWLDPEGKYKGPYDGGKKIPPGVKVEGDKKITFTFDQPRCEMPFMAAMGTTSPVPESEDTKTDYDKRPFSSGPYKIDKRTLNESMTLVRNEHWDPKTDPIRAAYPDKFSFEFGDTAAQISKRIEANASGDENLVSYSLVDAGILSNVTSNKDKYKGRYLEGPQKYNGYLAINNKRVTDLKVRQALNYAVNREGWIKIQGGKYAAQPSTTFMTPSVPGYNEFNAYPHNEKKAKELLDGKTVKLRYAYNEASETAGQAADMFKESYKKVGIELETIGIPDDDWYGQIGDIKNKYDLYWAGWGADWPSGSTVIPPTLGKLGIADAGGTNYSFFTEPEIEKEISRLEKLPAKETAKAWGELDEKIMKEYAPYIPLDYSYAVYLTGSNIGGHYLSDNISTIDVTQLFVRKP